MIPLVSIIMPVYNKELYMRKTLENICNQDFKNWELIIVDDGSTDNGKVIIEEYVKRDKRIFAYYQKNRGVSDARDNGLEYAKGEWIWFVDSDDIPSKNFLSEVFKMDIVKGTDVIVGNYSKVFPDGKVENMIVDEQGRVHSKDFPALFMKYQYVSGYWGYLWNKLIRRSLIKENKLSFEVGLTLAEDLKFMVKVYQCCESIYILSQKAMQYTVNAQNSSIEKKIDYLAQLEIQKAIYSWIIEKRNCIQYKSVLQRQISYYVAFSVFYGFEEGILPKSIIGKISDSKKILSLISEEGIDHVMRPIVRYIKKKQWTQLYLYLYGRNIIRNIYRTIKRKG